MSSPELALTETGVQWGDHAAGMGAPAHLLAQLTCSNWGVVFPRRKLRQGTWKASVIASSALPRIHWHAWPSFGGCRDSVDASG